MARKLEETNINPELIKQMREGVSKLRKECKERGYELTKSMRFAYYKGFLDASNKHGINPQPIHVHHKSEETSQTPIS